MRLDTLMVERGLAGSRTRAQALILAGHVVVADRRVDKPGADVPVDSEIRVRGADNPFVSRGGLKLAAALDGLGIDVGGLRCLDVGISTGGFTDCLLSRGAKAVVGIDVGRGQLAEKLRTDDRVILFDRTNIRSFDPASMPFPADLALIDVSFIGLDLVLPAVMKCVKPGGRVLALVKPQFQAGRSQVGKGGVVRDPGARRAAIDKVRRIAADLGLRPAAEFESPVTGPKGNVETFLLMEAPA